MYIELHAASAFSFLEAQACRSGSWTWRRNSGTRRSRCSTVTASTAPPVPQGGHRGRHPSPHRGRIDDDAGARGQGQGPDRDESQRSGHPRGALPAGQSARKGRSQSATVDHRPSTIDHRLSTIDHRPSTIDYRPSTIDHRPSTIDHRLSTIDHRLSTIDHRLSTNRPSTIDHRPSTIDHRPSTIDYRPLWRLPVLVETQEGYRNLCRLVTRMKLRSAKGEARSRSRISTALPPVSSRWRAARPSSRTATASVDSSIAWSASWPRQRVHRAAAAPAARRGSRQRNPRRPRLGLRVRSSPPTACASRRPRASALRRPHVHPSQDNARGAGRRLARNAERYLKPPAEMTALFDEYPGAVAETEALADRLR